MTPETYEKIKSLSTNHYASYTAVWDIKDKAVLERLAETDDDPGIRRIAVSRINDKAVVRRIKKTDPDLSVRRVAGWRLYQITRRKRNER